MGTTVQDLKRWYEEAKEKGATHMLVIVDTFDYGDYPVYVMPGQNPKMVKAEKCKPGNMQRLMECYAMHKPFDGQEKSGRYSMDFSTSAIKSPNMAVIKKLLHHSWKDIEFQYDGLTDEEKKLIGDVEFAALARWAQS